MWVESFLETGEGPGESKSRWSSLFLFLFLFLATTPEGGGIGGSDSSDKDESDDSKSLKFMRVSSSPDEAGGREADALCEVGRVGGEPLLSSLLSLSSVSR